MLQLGSKRTLKRFRIGPIIISYPSVEYVIESVVWVSQDSGSHQISVHISRDIGRNTDCWKTITDITYLHIPGSTIDNATFFHICMYLCIFIYYLIIVTCDINIISSLQNNTAQSSTCSRAYM